MLTPLRFDRSARHGAALVGLIFAAYLTIATDFSSTIEAADYAGSIPTDVPLVNLVQFVSIVLIYLVSFALVTTTVLRRVIAMVVVPLTLAGWAWFGIQAGTGTISFGGAELWAFLLNQGFITLVTALGGWLIVRRLHPLSWIVLIVAVAPPLVGFALDADQADATEYTLVVQGVVIAAGILAVVSARAIDRAARRGHRDVVPVAVTPVVVTPALRDPRTRYGIALGGVIFATYLNIATDFTGYLNATHYTSSASITALGFLQFALILVVYLASFLIIPTTPGRRLGAITLTAVVLLLWATFGIERSVGNIGPPVVVWFFLLNQGFITLLVSLGAWLIVRGRHPLSLLVLVIVVVPPVVAQILEQASVSSGAYALVLESVIVVGGFLGGALGWGIDALVRRSRGSSAPDVTPESA